MKSLRVAGITSLFGLLFVAGSVSAQPAKTDAGPDPTALPSVIPIFPLPDVMLFPDVTRPLHIFEPRYRAMLEDALKGDAIIGMVLLRPGFEADYEGRPPIFPIGCAGTITDVEQLPDGRYLIELRGLVKFRVTSEDQSRPYRLARVEAMPEATDEIERAALRTERQQLVSLLTPAVSRDWGAPPPEVPDEVVVNVLSQNLDISPSDRQHLLELDGPLLRSRALIALLRGK